MASGSKGGPYNKRQKGRKGKKGTGKGWCVSDEARSDSLSEQQTQPHQTLLSVLYGPSGTAIVGSSVRAMLPLPPQPPSRRATQQPKYPPLFPPKSRQKAASAIETEPERVEATKKEEPAELQTPETESNPTVFTVTPEPPTLSPPSRPDYAYAVRDWLRSSCSVQSLKL